MSEGFASQLKLLPGAGLRWGRALVPPALADHVADVWLGPRRWTSSELDRAVWEVAPVDDVLLLAERVDLPSDALAVARLARLDTPRWLFVAQRTFNALERSGLVVDHLVDGTLTGADLLRAGLTPRMVRDVLCEIDHAAAPAMPLDIDLVRGTVAACWMRDAVRGLGLSGPAVSHTQIARERNVSRAAVSAALAPYRRGRAMVGLPPSVRAPIEEPPPPRVRRLSLKSAGGERRSAGAAPRGGLARDVLRELGGIAGARAIASRLSDRLGEPVSVRQVRDSFRNVLSVQKLGAGYYAEGTAALPVQEFVMRYLGASGGRRTVDALVSAVLAAYPHGDAGAVRAWIDQVTERE